MTACGRSRTKEIQDVKGNFSQLQPSTKTNTLSRGSDLRYSDKNRHQSSIASSILLTCMCASFDHPCRYQARGLFSGLIAKVYTALANCTSRMLLSTSASALHFNKSLQGIEVSGQTLTLIGSPSTNSALSRPNERRSQLTHDQV